MLSPKFKIPLFDIDWTLLAKDKRRNIHDEAFFYTFEKVYGLKVAEKESAEGWVDSQVIIETVIKHATSEEEAKSKTSQAITAMIDYFMKHADKGHYEVMPGVKKLLESLKKLGLPMGLLTGNVEEIGWEKLRRAGIADYFTFGAFGSMAFKRVDLIPIAKKRLEEILGQKMPLENFVIVGDSPLDIACARAAGIPVIAVGAGHHKSDELSDADLVVDSLEERDKIIEFLKV